MQRPAGASDGNASALSYVALRSGRIAAWWCLAEYMIHVMYMHAIQSNETYLEILPPWALGTPSFIRLGFFYFDDTSEKLEVSTLIFLRTQKGADDLVASETSLSVTSNNSFTF